MWRAPDKFPSPSKPEAQASFREGPVTLIPTRNVAAALSRLHERGVQMAAVSNAFFSGRMLAEELERHGLGHFFRFVLSSGDVGVRKPHRAIFEAALSRLGVNCEDVWFVGDTLGEDIDGATAVGLQPVLFSKNPLEHLLPPTALVVKDWMEFTRLYEAAH